MPLGVALDTQDCELFSRVFKVAQFNEFIETLNPHLLGLDVGFRKQILDLVVERIPPSCNILSIQLNNPLNTSISYKSYRSKETTKTQPKLFMNLSRKEKRKLPTLWPLKLAKSTGLIKRYWTPFQSNQNQKNKEQYWPKLSVESSLARPITQL